VGVPKIKTPGFSGYIPGCLNPGQQWWTNNQSTNKPASQSINIQTVPCAVSKSVHNQLLQLKAT